MPSTLAESLELLKGVRAENGAAVAHLNDQELADLVHSQTGDERLVPAARSSSLQRGINTVGQAFKGAGQATEQFIAPEGSGYAQRLVGRVGGNLVSGLPELGAGIAAVTTRGLARPVLAALGGSYVYGRNKAETNDTGAALGESAGFLASLAGGVGGARMGANMATSKVGKVAGGSAGSIVGSMPGDYLGMVTQPGETMDLEQFRSDELGVPAYFLGQVAADPLIAVADKAGTKAKALVEKTMAATPDLASIIPKSAADEFAALEKKPLVELTELEAARKVELANQLAKADEDFLAKKIASKTVAPADVASDAETPATITAQLNQLGAGKRAAVELPKNSTLAIDDLPDIQLHFKKHVSEDGTSFIYDEQKTTPDQIENARKTNSMGYLLGYGVPGVPDAPSGEIAVLRNKLGVEKTAIILDEATKPTVLEALERQKVGEGDVVTVETAQQVMEWRQKNKGLVKLYSIAGGEMPDPQNDISFTNHVLDMFQSATQTKIRGYKQKGPKFQPDAQGAISGTGILKAVKDWAPGELWEHYKSRGIEQLLSPRELPAYYHGTGVKGIKKFDPNKGPTKGVTYFARNPDVTRRYGNIRYEAGIDESGLKLFDVANPEHLTMVRKAVKSPNQISQFFEYDESGPRTLERYFLALEGKDPFSAGGFEAQESSVAVLKSLGFDGYKSSEHIGGEIALFNPEKLVGVKETELPKIPWEKARSLERAGFVPKTILAPNKVSMVEFTKWIRENTPEVEVKKLVPTQQMPDMVDARRRQHEIETEGGTFVRALGGRNSLPAGFELSKATPPELRGKLERMIGEYNGAYEVAVYTDGGKSDAATGSGYKVEPKTLDQMPGAVDILVRVPTKAPPSTGSSILDKYGIKQEGELFHGHHFGKSDINVLASIRGYMETLPNGEKVFHIFELQSDWGQKVAKEKVNLEAGMHPSWNATKTHPLLVHYETLGLKTAIQHARAEGATKLAISDGETGMMTQGHDRHNPSEVQRFNTEKEARAYSDNVWYDATDKVWLAEPVVPQEKGMRAAYDKRLPAIMTKLTGDKGRPVDFGFHKVADESDGTLDDPGSPVFKDAQGQPKSRITARLYDITNPRPEVKRLFSLYDADAQTSFESSLRRQQEEIDSGRRPAEELSREQVLERAIGGNLAKLDPLLNFLNAVKGTQGAIRSETFANPNILASVDLGTGGISLNRDARLTVTQAFAKLAHEQGHLGIHSMPEPVKQALITDAKNLGALGRRGILDEVKSALKLGADFDTSYLAGEKFDPADPNYDMKVMHEFTGGLLEAAAHSHAQSIPTGWMAYLPVSIQKLLTKVMGNMKKLFSDDYPSLGAMMSDGERARLGRIVDQMQSGAVDAEQVNLRSLLKLGESSKFDETTFIDKLAASGDNQFAPKGGPSELHSFAGELYEGAKKGMKNHYQNLWFSGLFRARTKPETAGHFWALHNFRPSNKADEHSYLAYLGQQSDNSLSRQQAIERWASFFDNTILDTGTKGEKWRNAFGDVNEENQNRREASQASLSDKDLVTSKDMVEKHGMTEEQAEFTQRLIKSSELVAQEHIRKGEQEDITNLTRAFYGVNKNQDVEGVRQKVARLSRITKDAGDNRYQLVSYRDQLDRVRKSDNPDMAAEADLQMEVQKLEAAEANFNLLLDNGIRQEFAGAIPFKDGEDRFVSGISEMMVKLSSLRARERRITASAGWASMSRRGRYRIRVKDESPLGEDFGRVLEYRGFQTLPEMKKYIAEKGYTDSQIETFDMNEVAERVRAYTPSGLQKAHDLAKSQLAETLAEIQSKGSGLDQATQDVMSNVIHDIQASFRPVAQELADAISVKGDKFGQRRHNVAGFNKNDFLPNLFEYMQMRTVGGNKGLAAAESNLQISRRELDSQPELRERMLKEQQYTLSAQTEWNGAKKAIFYYYLGANFRHVIQNSVQIPLNGISQMVAEGHGVASYKHFAKAAKFATQYNYKGTTGDATIDVLLKQAEKDGISFSTAIEAPLHEGDALQNVLDSINANSDGKIGFGQKVGLAGTRVVRGMEKFLQATSEAAESANRKTTFIASVLAERAKGNVDPRAIYEKASQFTNFVNFVGDKPNRPGYMILNGQGTLHGPLGLLTALQSFTVNHISQLYSFYEKGYKQGSKADKAALAVGLAHLLVFAGGMGMIGASTAEQLFESATGKSLRTLYREGLIAGLTSLSDDEETKESLRFGADRIADTTMYGFPALAGVDMSNSIGLGSPFFRYQSGKPMGIEEFGGAGVGMLARVGQAVGKVATDPFNPQAWWSAARSGSPAFLGNAIKTYELLNSGASLDANQQPIGDPLGVGSSISALAGFNPMETSKQRDLNNQIYKSTKKSADDYQRTVLNISQLYSAYQLTGNEEMRVKAEEMMTTYVDSVGGLQDRDAMISSISAQVQQNSGKVTKPASLKESATRARQEAAFPSIKRPASNQLDALLDELGVAQALGQDDVLVRKIQSLPQTMQSKALADALAASGLSAQEVQQLLSPQSVGRLGQPR